MFRLASLALSIGLNGRSGPGSASGPAFGKEAGTSAARRRAIRTRPVMFRRRNCRTAKTLR